MGDRVSQRGGLIDRRCLPTAPKTFIASVETAGAGAVTVLICLGATVKHGALTMKLASRLGKFAQEIKFCTAFRFRSMSVSTCRLQLLLSAKERRESARDHLACG